MRFDSNKRLRASSLAELDTEVDAETSSNVDVAVAGPSTSRSSTSEGGNTGRSVFMADILPVMLDNLHILTPTDLLNFRLVNKFWRDAATRVLLKRSACDISLKIGQVVYNCVVNIESHEQLLDVDFHDDDHDHAPPIFRCCSFRPPHHLLSDLIRLISASPKFPSNSIKFLPGCERALENLSSSPANDDYELEEDEIMRLFALYGKEIKKLAFSSEIPILTVQNLLFIHLPNVTCLDLRNFINFDTPPQAQVQNQNEGFQFPLLLSQDSNFNFNQTKIERIYSGMEIYPICSKVQFIEKIMDISPNLHAIEDVNLGVLLLLKKMKMDNLVKSIQYNPPVNPQFVSPLAELYRPTSTTDDSVSQLKLKEIMVKFGTIGKHHVLYGRATELLNMILAKSRDTLEYLELHVNPDKFLVNIRIPQLRKLKCLKLVKENASFGLELYQSRAAAGARAGQNIPERVDQCEYNRHVFQFSNLQSPNRIPDVNYFPALSKVLLDVGGDPRSMNTCNMLLAFFSLEHPGIEGGSIVTGDIVDSVTTLEMTAFPDVDINLGKLFPNLRNLKINLSHLSKLRNWVWEAFPNMEIFEITNLDSCGQIKNLDRFFTGISQKICNKFAQNDEAATELEFKSEQIQFLRTQPYIGDCLNLTKFTLKFGGKLSNKSLSKLSSFHVFNGICHRTKIIFSFESAADLSEQELKDIRNHLKDVAPNIETRPWHICTDLLTSV